MVVLHTRGVFLSQFFFFLVKRHRLVRAKRLPRRRRPRPAVGSPATSRTGAAVGCAERARGSRFPRTVVSPRTSGPLAAVRAGRGATPPNVPRVGSEASGPRRSRSVTSATPAPRCRPPDPAPLSFAPASFPSKSRLVVDTVATQRVLESASAPRGDAHSPRGRGLLREALRQPLARDRRRLLRRRARRARGGGALRASAGARVTSDFGRRDGVRSRRRDARHGHVLSPFRGFWTPAASALGTAKRARSPRFRRGSAPAFSAP